jgi:hypothetical protein
MNNLLDFIERHKYGIIITLFVHVLLFLYLQIKTYQEVVVYETWSYRYKGKESPDDIIVDAEDIMLSKEDLSDVFFEDERITSFVSDASDKREKEFVEGEKYTSYKGDAYSNVRAFEEEVIANLASKRAGKSGEKNGEDEGEDDINQQDNGADKSSSEKKQGSEKGVAGKTMVTFELNNRKPFNNNDWHVRNPGYTCGNVNGRVAVQISVDQGGNVVAAKYLPEKSQGADDCMIRQAEKYAKLSRFNYDGSAPKTQSGIIEYLFVYRK